MRNASRMIPIALCLILIAVVALPAGSRAQDEYERVLVQFRPQRASIAGQIEGTRFPNAQIHHEFDELAVVSMSLPSSQIEALRNDPDVLSVEPDALRYPTGQVIPYGVEDVQAPALWDANGDGVVDPGAPDGSGRLVCVIDSGVYLAHEDFAGVNFVGGYPATKWYLDGCGHGTHVAGTIAAMSNDTGVVGVSPGAVSLYIVRVFGDGCGWAYVSDLIAAALKCRDAGANIINMSLSGDIKDDVEEMVFDLLYNNYGILSIAAAGNNGSTAYAYPASYGSVISVAAVDHNNNVAGFSQKNDQVELAAPGVNILSTWKDGGYATMSGTSMAAPHVAAAAALVWGADPTKTNAEIRQIFQETALDLGTSGEDDASGYGLIRSMTAYESLSGSPTAVTMSRFEATGEAGAIRLEWETATEIDVLGFNLYRRESQDGPEARLNGALVPSQSPGSPVGAAYSFLDDTAAPGTTYTYWLEGVDVRGEGSRYGPVSAFVEPAAIYRLFLPMVGQ
jgi:hypothetical protein